MLRRLEIDLIFLGSNPVWCENDQSAQLSPSEAEPDLDVREVLLCLTRADLADVSQVDTCLGIQPHVGWPE